MRLDVGLPWVRVDHDRHDRDALGHACDRYSLGSLREGAHIRIAISVESAAGRGGTKEAESASYAEVVPGTRIAISEHGRVAKVTIIVPFRDGGVALAAPYTKDRKGLLVTMKPSDKLGTTFVPDDELTAQYSASDRVKLSLHRDGFAQFSGAGIRSGKDEDGKPKGLAIQMRRPFMHPIQTGPTFAITVWGLDRFDPLRKRDADAALVFDENDVLYRSASPEHWSGYVIEGFVFPNNLLRNLRPLGPGKTVLPMFHPRFEGHGAHFNFRVILLPSQSVFLGFLVSRIEVEPIGADGARVASGSVLNGPRDFDGIGLYAFCPSPYTDGAGAAASLDWDPVAEPKADPAF